MFNETENPSSAISSLINKDDVQAVLKIQHTTLERLEKSNEMLINCNALSKKEYDRMNLRFQHHILFLQEMQKDLQSIFSRIRNLKKKQNLQYPVEFALALEDNLQNVSKEEASINSVSINQENKNELYETSTKLHFADKRSST